MTRKRIEGTTNLFAFFVVAIVVFFTILRQFFGVELTDEAYSVADTYMVSKGALPFVNNWSQMPGWTILLAPFVKIYTLINGTEGIFLFFRFLCIGINAVTAIIMARLLRGYIQGRLYLTIFSVFYFCASGFDALGGFRGDKLSINLTAIGVMLLVVYFTGEKAPIWYLFISGILLSLSVLSYPTYFLLFFFYVFTICVFCKRRHRGYKELLLFLLGASVSTIVILLYLVINSGIEDIFIGIRYLINDVSYFQLKNDGILKVPDYASEMSSIVLDLLRAFIKPFLFFLIVMVIFFEIISDKEMIRTDSNYIYIKKPNNTLIGEYYSIKKNSIRQLLLLTVITGICLYHVNLIKTFSTADHTEITLRARTIETLGVLLIYPFVKKEKKICKYFVGLIWLPSYVWVVITGIGTYSSIIGRHHLLKNTAFLFGIVVYFAIKDNFITQFENKELNGKLRRIVSDSSKLFTHLIPVIVMTVICFTSLFNAYSYVYRDESIRKLDTVVTSGPYKGLLTTHVRAKGLLELSQVINLYVSGDDYLLAMDNDPFVYLLSDAHICTPCSWDMALYSYNFDRPEIYYDYFNVTATEPTKILYFNYGRDEALSIDVDYSFNDFVRSNYKLDYEDRNIFEWKYCGRTVNCELLIFEKD